MTPITTVLAFLVTLGVLIVVHEYGHYRVAVACGVKVLRFSVGFGRVAVAPPAAARRTEFVVCALPLGGYVRMLDEREGPVAPDERHRAFNRKPLVAAHGDRGRRPARQPAARGAAVRGAALDRHRGAEGGARPAGRGSLAERAGLRAGDWVRAVSTDGDEWQDLRSLTDLRWQVTQAVMDGAEPAAAGQRQRRARPAPRHPRAGVARDAARSTPS